MNCYSSMLKKLLLRWYCKEAHPLECYNRNKLDYGRGSGNGVLNRLVKGGIGYLRLSHVTKFHIHHFYLFLINLTEF
jgi:hypothetical protein